MPRNPYIATAIYSITGSFNNYSTLFQRTFLKNCTNSICRMTQNFDGGNIDVFDEFLAIPLNLQSKSFLQQQ